MGKIVILALTVTMLLGISDRAYAYLDPATGSMIVQAVLAAIAAVSITVGVFWSRLKAFLGHHFWRRNNKDGK